ncbi:MAG: ribosome-associated translation inhibitor RaiA [Trueperaceae bacterium]|nr:MAG: ribosome-associated translation inhibitor RaiA [Trueperaceae bacterium]
MNIYQLIGRNIDITDSMRNYAEEKLQKLDRFSDQIVDAKVVMSYGGNASSNAARVEVQLNVPNGIVRAEESGQDTYAAIDKVVDKLERQLKRFKGRFIARRLEERPQPTLEESEEFNPAIVRTKRHVLRPMDPEDAAVQMEALGHSFFMFRNAETDAVNVIYLRNDGHYGLIEPA